MTHTEALAALRSGHKYADAILNDGLSSSFTHKITKALAAVEASDLLNEENPIVLLRHSELDGKLHDIDLSVWVASR
jgi:predicted acetyltransferase